MNKAPKVVFNHKVEYSRFLELQEKYKELFSSELGEVVLENLLIQCGTDKSMLDKDVHIMYYNNGKRDIGLYIRQYLLAEPMMKEDLE